MALKYTFKKEERLCSKKKISLLFNSSSSFLVYPFLVTYKVLEESQISPAQVIFIVSKKKFKNSVDRNLIRRKMKESYRLLKPSILYPYLEVNNYYVIFSINYIAKEILDYKIIFRKTQLILNKLTHELDTNAKEHI